MSEYDSTVDTLRHIKRVQELLGRFAIEMINRGIIHDESKLYSPEKEMFDKETPLLKDLKFGSNEYADSLARLKPALEHHYAMNSHHPEHYKNGINGMDLYDLVEMFFDWKAASERTVNSNFDVSLTTCFTRFNIDQQLASILKNTAFKLYRL